MNSGDMFQSGDSIFSVMALCLLCWFWLSRETVSRQHLLLRAKKAVKQLVDLIKHQQRLPIRGADTASLPW